MSTVTLETLIDKVRRKAGIEDSAFITSSENTITDAFITDEINSAASQIHQQMTVASEDYFTVTYLVTVTDGYTYGVLPDDLFKLRTIDKWNGGDGYTAVPEFSNVGERHNYQGIRGMYGYAASINVPSYTLGAISAAAPGGVIHFLPPSQAPGNYLISYTPQYQDLANDDDAVTFPMNWHDYIVTYAAMQCMTKLLLPIDDIRAQAALFANQIVKGAARRGQPRRMLNLRNQRRW